jgi:hypothetical protein
MDVDLRKLNQATLDVNLRSFSQWCWDGLCRFRDDKTQGAECGVTCGCECHGVSR